MALIPKYTSNFYKAADSIDHSYILGKRHELKNLIESYQNSICHTNNKTDRPIYVPISSFCEWLSTIKTDINSDNNIDHNNYQVKTREFRSLRDLREEIGATISILFKEERPFSTPRDRVRRELGVDYLTKEHIVNHLKKMTKCDADLLCEKLDTLPDYIVSRHLDPHDRIEWDPIRLVLEQYHEINTLDSNFGQLLLNVYNERVILSRKGHKPLIIGSPSLFELLPLLVALAPLLMSTALGLRFIKAIAGYKKESSGDI